MEKELITIIIPMYNMSKYIKRCIMSIKKQTYKDFEAIFIDDGSKDNTVEIWKENTKEDKRFILLQKENTGVSDTRNYGLEKANGKYITFIDSDDWVEPQYLEFLFNSLKENNVEISCCGYFENTGKKKKRKLTFPSKIITKTEALNPFSEYYFTAIWGKLINKKYFVNKSFRSDIFFSEDTLFYTEIIDCCDNIFWSSEPLYHYYINAEGAMKIRNPHKYFTDFEARKKILTIYNKYPQLLELANLRTTESAINVKLEFMKQDFNNKKMIKELDQHIKKNIDTYLKSSYVSKYSKIKYFIIKNKFLFISYKSTKKIIKNIKSILHK